MFDIGMPELIVILIVALLFIGPNKLPEVAKTIGKVLSDFKKSLDDLKDSIDKDNILPDAKSFLSLGDEAEEKKEPKDKPKKEEPEKEELEEKK